MGTNFIVNQLFALDPNTYEEAVVFLVLEDKQGNLILGDYIGD